MKKKTELMIESMDRAKKRDEWLKKMNTYTISLPGDKKEIVVADGYLVGEYKWHEPQPLVFFIRCGDELVEIARFREWESITRDVLSFYKEKSP